MSVLESAIERRFVNRLKEIGVVAIKLNIFGNVSWPDRMVILPRGRVAFVEFKRPGEELRPHQVYTHSKLKELGHDVTTFDDAAKAVEYIVGKLGT